MAFYLKNAHVLDVEKGTFFSADVKIENKKIVSLDEKAPDGADAVDCTGKYLTPGVMDAHVHLVWDGTSPDPMGDTIKDGNYVCFAKGVRGAMDSLKAGVTTVRDVGSHDDASIPLASAINRGIIQGANILPAGSAIQGSYGHCPMIGFIANTEAQLIDRIKRLKGYDIEMSIPPIHWAKIMASGGAAGLEDVGPCMYSPKELETLVYEAHRLNMKVAAHALSYDAISKCVDAGIDTIEHGAEMTEEILLKMKEQGQCWVPTVAVYKSLVESEGIIADVIVEKAKVVAENQRKSFKKAMEIGVKIILGSDAGSANFGPHPSAYLEMFTMHEYGMPNADVIRCATIAAANELGIGTQRGSIEAGKLADKLREYTIALYKKCAEYALEKGIIIADTKFEFGLDENGNIVLGDEMLTPDSSRFWPAQGYEAGHSQPSFDKQFARDWLTAHPGNDWTLPQEIVDKTIEKYLQSYEMLTGEKLA